MKETNNIGVFIDFENFAHPELFDAGKLIDKLKERGRLIVKKAYADWGRFYKYKSKLLENSIELTEMPSHSNRGKNSADIKLTVDALETALTKDYIDTFVIVSGDSDYTPLISKLREYNKYVVAIGHKENMSKLLKGFCDEMIFYSALVGLEEEDMDAVNLEEAYRLLTRSIEYLDNQGIPTVSSQVKGYMRQLDASFNESNYGFSQFKNFLHRAQKDSIVALSGIEGRGDYLIQTRNNHNAFEDGNGRKRSEACKAQFLAQIRKHSLQFLGPDLQYEVLKAIHSIMLTLPTPRTRLEILENLLDGELNSLLERGEISKTKINCVFNIPYRARCFDLTKNDEEPVRICLSDEFKDYLRFKCKHDELLLSIALQNQIEMSPRNWSEILYGTEDACNAVEEMLSTLSVIGPDAPVPN